MDQLEDQDGITAYHGSPHDFEKFDLSKIGTGEGAQAFGHGLYFAEAEPVAKEYKNKTSQGTYKNKSGDIFDPSDLEHMNLRVAGRRNIDEALQTASGLLESQPQNAEMIQRDIAKLNEAKQKQVIPNKGHMYEVSINSHPDNFLDWDHDLNHYNNMVVGDMLPGVKHYDRVMSMFKKAPTGEEFYNGLAKIAGSYETASKLLHQAGVKGVKYLDEDSRNKTLEPYWELVRKKDNAAVRQMVGRENAQKVLTEARELVPDMEFELRGPIDKRTRNYVVFDHDLVNVKRKYARGGGVSV